MNRKGLIGVAVCLGIVLVGIVGAVLFFIPGITFKRGNAHLVTVPPQNYHKVPAGIAFFEISCEWKDYDPGEGIGNVRWIDPRGQEVSDSYGSPRTYVRYNALKLKFLYPHVNESGVYTCSGRNDRDYKIPVTIHFFEREPPRFDVNSEDVTAYEESDFELFCDAVGAEPMTYRWYNWRNELISNDTSSGIYVSSSSLYIENVRSIHKGLYTCEATNGYGTAAKKFYVALSKDGTPKFDTSSRALTVGEGSQLKLQCRASGERPMTYTWYDQADQIIQSSNWSDAYIVTSSSESILTVERAQISDGGVYTCTASNRRGIASLIFDVKVTKSGAPTFPRTFENVTAKERSELELLCYSDNDIGTTSYAWYNQHNETVPSDQASPEYASTTLKGSVLTLSAVKMSHSGVYECRARNEHGLASKLFYVTISSVRDGIPTFDKDYEYVLAEEGSKLSLQCKALGEGPMTYQWYNQHEKVISSDEELPVYVSNSEDGSELVIKKIQVNDKGVYTCTAQNKDGMYSKLFDISVYPSNENNTEDPSIRHVEVRKVTSNSVLFGIATTGAVDAIEVKYTENQDKEQRTASFKTGDAYEVQNLVPGGLYEFMFRIHSASNDSWSDAYTVILLPDRPEVIIRNVQTDRLEIEWFKTLDTIMRGTIIKYEISYYSVQIEGGTYWKPSTCVVTVHLPACRGSRHTITGFSTKVYYEVQVRAFTEAGSGEAYKHKFYMP